LKDPLTPRVFSSRIGVEKEREDTKVKEKAMNTTSKQFARKGLGMGYYETKTGKIIKVYVHWRGLTKKGDYLAKVSFPGQGEDKAFWVDAHNVSLCKYCLNRDWNDDNDNF